MRLRSKILDDWELIEDIDNGGHYIRLASAKGNSGTYEPQHYISYDHGLYCDEGEQFKEAEEIAELIVSSPKMYKAITGLLDWLSAPGKTNKSRESRIPSKIFHELQISIPTLE